MTGQAKRKSAKSKRPTASSKRPLPGLRRKRIIRWDIIVAAAVVVALIGFLGYRYVPKALEQAEMQAFAPSDNRPDPSERIEGVVKVEYPAGQHVTGTQRVGYNRTPAFGGPHDQYWATCTGIVYPQAIRTENAVHSLEHGAVWITYNPDLLSQADIAALRSRVEGKSYMLMSPYPNLATPVSLQSWGHQLGIDEAQDERIVQFITALRQNPNTHPEFGASCATMGGGFDPDAPPPFDPSTPGPDAVPVKEGKGDF